MKRTKFSPNGIDDYINLLRERAWSFHKTTGLEYGELLSEAYIAYHNALQRYRRRRGAFSTLLYYTITSHLKNFHAKKYSFIPRSDKKVEDLLDSTQETFSWFQHKDTAFQKVVEIAQLYSVDRYKDPTRIIQQVLQEQEKWSAEYVTETLEKMKRFLESQIIFV